MESHDISFDPNAKNKQTHSHSNTGRIHASYNWEVEKLNSFKSVASFSIVVKGCPDPKLASSFAVERKDNTARVSCKTSGESWTLRCDGTNWVGSVGNCSLCK